MSTEAEELYSLLVPLAGERLIVPRACVAEVVRYTAPGNVRDRLPDTSQAGLPIHSAQPQAGLNFTLCVWRAKRSFADTTT